MSPQTCLWISNRTPQAFKEGYPQQNKHRLACNFSEEWKGREREQRGQKPPPPPHDGMPGRDFEAGQCSTTESV
eukprot:6285495-Pyramimonas_sp.AAC.1